MPVPVSNPPEPPQLAQKITGWQVLLYGLGSMLGAGIYGLIGRAAEHLGNAVWAAFLLAMLAALLTGLSYASVGSRFPKAGGAAYVSHRAFGWPLLSYVVGLSITMSGLTSMATGAQLIAETLDKAIPAALPIKFVAIGLVALLGLLVFWGIEESMRANLLCTLVEVGGLLFIIFVGLRFWGGVNYLETAHDLPGGHHPGSGLSLGLILQGAVLTFFSFIGFEDILNVSEEVKNPRRAIPFGLIGAMLVATAVYLAVAITAVSVIPWQELAASKTPLMDVAKRAAPWFKGIDGVYLAITIFAVGNTALLNYIMGSRLLYGMSRQSLLPAIIGRVHPVRRTPHTAILVLCGIVTLLILSGSVKQLAEATVMLLLTVFVVVNTALVILQRRPNEPPGGFEIPPAIPIAGALVCLLLLLTRIQGGFASENTELRIAPLIALGIIGGSAALFFLTQRGKGNPPPTDAPM
jgi:amino acid transporter